MKEAAGFRRSTRRGARAEKIICLKNRNDLGLVNGMFLDLADVRGRDRASASPPASAAPRTAQRCDRPGDGRYFIYKGHFDDHVAPDRERERRDHWIKKGLIEAVWGYAITCHKARARSGGTSSSSTMASAAPPRTARAGSTPRSPAPRKGW